MATAEFLPTVAGFFDDEGHLRSQADARDILAKASTDFVRKPSPAAADFITLNLYTPLAIAKYTEAETALRAYTWSGGNPRTSRTRGEVFIFTAKCGTIWHILRRGLYLLAAVKAQPSEHGVYVSLLCDDEPLARQFCQRVVAERLLPEHKRLRSEPVLDLTVSHQDIWTSMAYAPDPTYKVHTVVGKQVTRALSPDPKHLVAQLNAGQPICFVFTHKD